MSMDGRWGLGKGSPFPSRGSRAERSPAELRRSAAFRGRSPPEEGVQGEETHNVSRRLHHATSESASAGVLYPRAECSRWRL